MRLVQSQNLLAYSLKINIPSYFLFLDTSTLQEGVSVGRLVGQLVGRLVGQSVGPSVSQLVGWLVGRLVIGDYRARGWAFTYRIRMYGGLGGLMGAPVVPDG